jgi:hypothetical protein
MPLYLLLSGIDVDSVLHHSGSRIGETTDSDMMRPSVLSPSLPGTVREPDIHFAESNHTREVRGFTDAPKRCWAVQSQSEEIGVGFIRRNWQQITIARRERFLRRGLLSLAIALVAATLAAKLAMLLFGMLLIIASSDPGSNVFTEEVVGIVSALLAVIAAVVAIFSFVRGLALLATSTKPSVSADSAPASAHLPFADGEREAPAWEAFHRSPQAR